MPEVLDPDERARLYGIECTNDLQFHGWAPGGEYKTHLMLKNVGVKIQQITWKLPKTKFFELKFPEWIKLSPGMIYTAEITFRPIREEPYDDFIEFIIREDNRSFFVPIRATLESARVILPEILDFSFCPCNETAQKTFVVQNIGERAAPYVFRVDAPFSLLPSSGVLQPGQAHVITASFTPKVQEASVFDAVVVCHVDESVRGGGDHFMHISGRGKYPYVSAEMTKFDFGDVYCGKTERRTFYVHNHSQVHATFKIRCESTNISVPFHFSPEAGIIPPQSSSQFTVTYKPAATGTFSADDFVLSTPGGNSISYSCMGNAIGPKVRLQTTNINFGDVMLGTSLARVLTMHNDSPVMAHYQLLLEKGGVFRVKSVQGTIPPLSSTHVTVNFVPPAAFNYYRRIFILIRHQVSLG